jgi:hypothetical protein
MQLTRPSVFALGAITALTLGGGTAYAATGGTFVLGRANTATTTTTLTDSAGTPLALNAKAGSAPLTVNSAKTVTNLSADRLDGLSSTSFLRSTGKAADAEKVDGVNGASLALTTGRSGVVQGSATDADGDVSTARCPAGTIATGGGGGAFDTAASLAYSGPDFDPDTGALIPGSWYAEASTGGAVAYVICYNPRGAVPGASTRLSTRAAVSGLKNRSARGQ